MCNQLKDAGQRGFHFYTLNLERSTRLILEGLDFVAPLELVKPLPWNPVCFSVDILHLNMKLISKSDPNIFSPLPKIEKRKMSDQFFGEIESLVTSNALKAGMNFLMVGGGMPALLLMVMLKFTA
jgi:hypothetical protein